MVVMIKVTMAHATAYRMAEVTGSDAFFWERGARDEMREKKKQSDRHAAGKDCSRNDATRSHQVRTTWTADPIVIQLKTRKATHWANREERVLSVSPVSALILGSSMAAWLLIAVCD